MKKIKHVFKLISTFFICTACVFLSACGGGASFDEEHQLGVSLDNIKILRRSYGEDKATINAINQSYYDKYVGNVIKYINSFYGIVNKEYTPSYDNVFQELNANIQKNTIEISNQIENIALKLQTDFENNEDYFKYFYDAMRHQIVNVSKVYVPRWTNGIMFSNAETCPEGYSTNVDSFLTKPNGIAESDFNYYQVTVDTQTGWNWGTNYLLSDGTNSANSFVYEYGNSALAPESIQIDGTLITSTFAKEDFSYKTGAYLGFYGYYQDATYNDDGLIFNQDTYNNALYPQEAESQPTEFEKALSYALYSIVNNETPQEISVTKGTNGNTFKVGEMSIDDALKTAKETYTEKASYVGLTKGDQEKFAQYILDEVIGQKALTQSNKTGSMQDLYYEEIVSAVVAYCATLTDIGGNGVYTEDDPEVAENPELLGRLKDPTYISGQYLSSDIADYENYSSYVNGQLEGMEEFSHLGEYEYQSMMIMPTESVKIDEMWLDFGYAGNGGTNDYIKIMTYVRFYKGNGEFEIVSKPITIYENSVDVGEEGTTVQFSFSDTAEGYIKADVINFDDAINSESYKEKVKNNSLFRDYSKELIIGANTEARKYYSLVEGEYRDYGVFNYEMLKGTEFYDKCYVEVAFEVMSASCENYKFYCGFNMINEYVGLDASKWN